MRKKAKMSYYECARPVTKAKGKSDASSPPLRDRVTDAILAGDEEEKYAENSTISTQPLAQNRRVSWYHSTMHDCSSCRCRAVSYARYPPAARKHTSRRGPYLSLEARPHLLQSTWGSRCSCACPPAQAWNWRFGL